MAHARAYARESCASSRTPARCDRTYTAAVRDPAIGEILVQPDELQHRVRELGAEISRDYAGTRLLLVGVLKGAVFFLSDLMRYIEIPCEVDFMAVASYGSATDSSRRRAHPQGPRRGHRRAATC